MQFETVWDRGGVLEPQLCPPFGNVAYNTIDSIVIIRETYKPAQKNAAPFPFPLIFGHTRPPIHIASEPWPREMRRRIGGVLLAGPFVTTAAFAFLSGPSNVTAIEDPELGGPSIPLRVLRYFDGIILRRLPIARAG